MVKRKITNHLAVLQSRMKRDPEAYRDEFVAQFEHMKVMLRVFTSKVPEWNEELAELLLFIAHMMDKYKSYANEYFELLERTISLPSMGSSSMRNVLLNCLMLLRRKDGIEPDRMYTLLFCQVQQNQSGKAIYKISRRFIIRDLQLLHLSTTRWDNKIRNFLNRHIQSENRRTALLAIDIIAQLFDKMVWLDEQTVNYVADGCFSPIPKVRLRALKFLLGIDDGVEDESEEEDEEKTEQQQIKQALLSHRVGKKTGGRSKKKEKMLRVIKRRCKQSGPLEYDTFKLRLIRDPQGFSEKLFKYLEKCNDGYNVKIMLTDLISRLIGVNSLILLNFYPNIQRYLNPRQPEITKILLYAAQATHNLVPPDVMNEMTRCIAVNFVNETNPADTITFGLNALREICRRCPYALEDYIISDLGTYRSFKDKNVSSAARSLINAIREINPALLPAKLRAKPTEESQSLGKRVVPYGTALAKDIIPGTEVLVRGSKALSEDAVHRRALKLICTKSLSEEQLRAIKQEQIRRAVDLIGGRAVDDDLSSEESDSDPLPNIEDIEQYRLSAKERSRQEKAFNELKGVKSQAASSNKLSPVRSKKKFNGKGLSNKAKKTKKLFSMMKHKYKTKANMSLGEKQRIRQRAIKKMKRRKK